MLWALLLLLVGCIMWKRDEDVLITPEDAERIEQENNRIYFRAVTIDEDERRARRNLDGNVDSDESSTDNEEEIDFESINRVLIAYELGIELPTPREH